MKLKDICIKYNLKSIQTIYNITKQIEKNKNDINNDKQVNHDDQTKQNKYKQKIHITQPRQTIIKK